MYLEMYGTTAAAGINEKTWCKKKKKSKNKKKKEKLINILLIVFEVWHYQTSSRNDIGHGLHGYSSSGTSRSLSTKVKFLCSFGGKILPRPSDGRLRYVGGETRIVRISKDISWQELMQKTLTIYSQTHTITQFSEWTIFSTRMKTSFNLDKHLLYSKS